MTSCKAAVLIVLTLASGCTTATAADRVTLALGWLPTGSNAYFFMAKAGGFFAAEHLDVDILSGKGASDAMTKVANGVADFGEAGVDALLTARVSSNLPLKAVMPIYTMPPDALITASGTGIGDLKDLKGKRVATTPFTQSNGPWPFLLTLNGVDPSSVTLIKADPTTLVPMLATGQVDAVIQFTTNAPAQRERARFGRKADQGSALVRLWHARVFERAHRRRSDDREETGRRRPVHASLEEGVGGRA